MMRRLEKGTQVVTSFSCLVGNAFQVDLLGRSLKFRGEVQIGDVKLGAIIVWLVLIALRPDESSWRKRADKREAA